MRTAILLGALLFLTACEDRDTFKTNNVDRPATEAVNDPRGMDPNARQDLNQPRPKTEKPAQAALGTNESAGAQKP